MEETQGIRSEILNHIDNETTQRFHQLSKEFIKIMSYYKSAMLEIETRFQALNEEYLFEYERYPINSIKTRMKSLPSIQEKMIRRNIPFTLKDIEQQLNDIAGVRVICAFPADVYRMAEAFLKQDDIVLLQKKDYIAEPKANGYRSLHLIVEVPVHLAAGKRMTKVEIQIRTIAMDFWASLEHQLRYKQDVEFSDEMAAELYECAVLSAQLDNRMDNLRRSVHETKESRYAPAKTEKESLTDQE